MAEIAVEGLWKTYDRIRYVLEDVSFEMGRGEIVALVGRSGSGKTTLLNVLAGLEGPTQGRVLLRQTDMSTLEESARSEFRLRNIGIVFERFNLIPELTVAENVRLPMVFAKRRDVAARATELLGFFGIQDRSELFPATLSGGERQRVAIARALANDPTILLVDEPTANLDEENAKKVLLALSEVAQRLGTAVLVATHDPIVREIGQRVLRLSHGRVSPDPVTGTKLARDEARDPPPVPPRPNQGSRQSG